MKIMIIEDDPVIKRELKNHLEAWSYEVELANDYIDIIGEVTRAKPHLILLDINLPTKNGYYWCQEIRKISSVPIIFISSRADNIDQVMAMQMGGDDYLVKPFDINIMLAKIQALLRRTYDFTLGQKHLVDKMGLEFDIGEASLAYRDKKVDLTRTEVQIIEVLFKDFDKFVSRDQIIDHCWQGDNYIDDNTLAVNIYRLRKKLGDLGLGKLIETKVNVGYRLDRRILE